MIQSKIAYREKLPVPAAFHQLFETTGWNQSYRAAAEELYEAISASWYTLSAYDTDELVGFGRVVSDGVLYALICDLIVKPSCQGRGIGSTLLNKLIDRCRQQQVRVIWLFSAKGKSSFYKKSLNHKIIFKSLIPFNEHFNLITGRRTINKMKGLVNSRIKFYLIDIYLSECLEDIVTMNKSAICKYSYFSLRKVFIPKHNRKRNNQIADHQQNRSHRQSKRMVGVIAVSKTNIAHDNNRQRHAEQKVVLTPERPVDLRGLFDPRFLAFCCHSDLY